ncbi:MAG TPA: ATP-binding protein, partial [Phototrophicaceae bacterium]|nr:ATP-binding protein [Phototrophicaceae bacterium]
MTTSEHRLQFPAQFEQIEAACEFVTQQAASMGMDDDSVYHCRLSVEEICTNIIEHGYEGRTDGSIEIVCQISPDSFTIIIIDDAPAFNPLN